MQSAIVIQPQLTVPSSLPETFPKRHEIIEELFFFQNRVKQWQHRQPRECFWEAFAMRVSAKQIRIRRSRQ